MTEARHTLPSVSRRLLPQAALAKVQPPGFQIRTIFLPVLVSLILLIPTVLYWAHERVVTAEFQQSRVAQFRLRLAKRIQTEVDNQLRPLRRLGDEVASGDVASAAAFASSAHSICREEPTLRYIAWILPDGRCLSAYPPGATVTTADTLFGAGNTDHGQLAARIAGAPDGLLLSLPGASAADSADRLIVLPIKATHGAAAALSSSAIVTRETTKAMLGALMPPDAAAPFIVEVKDERGRLLFASDGANTQDAQQLLRSADVDEIPVLNQSWAMAVVAAPAGLGQRPSGDTDAFLLAGLIVSLFGGLTVSQAGRHRRRERQRTSDHLAALEALHAVAASISCKPRAESEIFDLLLDAACQLLRMPIALVVQLEGDRVKMARQIGFHPPIDWEYRALSDLPMIARCASTGEMLTVENREVDLPSSQNAAMERRNLASMLIFPLSAGDERIGIMALCDEKPRHFSDEDFRLARLWASQAAVTLANQRLAAANDEALKQQQLLNQQIRSDADAKAMLLRELNHRVKNNLAGIVGLLSAGRPELTEHAQQWLDRSIARIETLARAHELFVGTSSELSIADLVSKTLNPICAMKPAGVQIKLDLAAVNDPLSTDQAVTLAMVVHELASNAIQHGVASDGSLLIRSSRASCGWVKIEIISVGSDKRGNAAPFGSSPGSGTGTLAAPSIQTGIGLQLVRGLVGRELHGTFSLREIDSGGMIATVQFPISGQIKEDRCDEAY
jgi:two-component sensor histidine kinase